MPLPVAGPCLGMYCNVVAFCFQAGTEWYEYEDTKLFAEVAEPSNYYMVPRMQGCEGEVIGLLLIS